MKSKRLPVAAPALAEGSALETLLLGLTPIEPPADRTHSLRDRVLAVTRESAGPRLQNRTIPAEDGQWLRIFPKVEMKVLQDTPACKTVLYRFEPGGVLPAHHHHGEEECIVLEGAAQLGDVHVRRGDYHLAFENTDHMEVRSPTGAVLFVRHTRQPAL